MKVKMNIKQRPKLNTGEYMLYNIETASHENKLPIVVENLCNLNNKKVHSTYRAALRINHKGTKSVYIKLCDNLDFALSLAKQFNTFYELTLSQRELIAPAVLGLIKCPPCVVTEQIKGDALDRVFLKKIPKIEINNIANNVGLFLSLYHERYGNTDELNRINSELLDFALRLKLSVDRVKMILEHANLSAVRVHHDPKPANFLWDSETSMIGVLDPTHEPYIRFPHYDLAIVLYFPLYYRHLGWIKNLNTYRRHVIESYCRHRGIEWNWANEALAGLSILQNFEKYEQECLRYNFTRKLFLKRIISIKRHYLIKKYGLR